MWRGAVLFSVMKSSYVKCNEICEMLCSMKCGVKHVSESSSSVYGLVWCSVVWYIPKCGVVKFGV